MTIGEGIKKAAAGTKNVTDRVVDAVQDKVHDVTDAVGDKVHDVTDAVGGASDRTGDKIHKAAGRSDTPQEKKKKKKKKTEQLPGTEPGARQDRAP